MVMHIGKKTGKQYCNGTGFGIKAFVEAFKATKIQWGCIKVLGIDDRENATSRRPKYVQVNWVGSDVKATNRAMALQGKGIVKKLMKGIAMDVDTGNKSEITMNG